MKLRKLLAMILSVLSLITLLIGCNQTPALPPPPSNAEPTPAEKWGVDKLIIVLLPQEDSPEMVSTRNVFDTALTEMLGIPVEEYHATSYSAGIEAMRTGHAHVASFGPFSYVSAVERSGAECFAAAAVGGVCGYYSYLITHVDSDIHTVDDLKGRSFGFVDPESTSGNIVPTNEIINYFEKEIPDLSFDDLHINGRFFDSVMFTGNHSNSVRGVFMQDIEAAAVSSTTLAREIANGQVEADKIRIIHSSPLIPNGPWAIKDTMNQALKDALAEFFIGWDDPAFFQTRYPNAPATRFEPINDATYDYIRELRDRFQLSD